jgi:hypothetical protein
MLRTAALRAGQVSEQDRHRSATAAAGPATADHEQGAFCAAAAAIMAPGCQIWLPAWHIGAQGSAGCALVACRSHAVVRQFH